MFERKLDTPAAIIECLATAYRSLEKQDWDYLKMRDLEKKLIDGCMESSDQLQRALTLVGQSLLSRDKTLQQNAEDACHLFTKLYASGFKDGNFKSTIRNQFNKILPSATIESLACGEVDMRHTILAFSMISALMINSKAGK